MFMCGGCGDRLVGSFSRVLVCVRENVCVCAVGVVMGLFAGWCVYERDVCARERESVWVCLCCGCGNGIVGVLEVVMIMC